MGGISRTDGNDGATVEAVASEEVFFRKIQVFAQSKHSLQKWLGLKLKEEAGEEGREAGTCVMIEYLFEGEKVSCGPEYSVGYWLFHKGKKVDDFCVCCLHYLDFPRLWKGRKALALLSKVWQVRRRCWEGSHGIYQRQMHLHKIQNFKWKELHVLNIYMHTEGRLWHKA